jgi:hypothetical protein
MRPAVLALTIAALSLGLSLSAQPANPYAYAPHEGRLLSMEWRKVLDSNLREAVRKEIPPDMLPLVSSVNFIEGIQRVVVAEDAGREFIVLGGRFDLEQITGQATEDGGVVNTFRGAKFLAPTGAKDTDTQIALVNSNLVLLGPADLLKTAIIRSLSKRAALQPPSYDLWLRSPTATFGILLGDEVRLEAVVQAASVEKAKELTSAAKLQDLVAVQNDNEVVLTTSLHPYRFYQNAGNWRVSIENLHLAPKPVEPAGPQRVKIIGLEGGTKEIDLPPAGSQQ